MVTMAERVAKIETKVEGIDYKLDEVKKQIQKLDDKFVLRKEFIIIVGILGTVATLALASIIRVIWGI